MASAGGIFGGKVTHLGLYGFARLQRVPLAVEQGTSRLTHRAAVPSAWML